MTHNTSAAKFAEVEYDPFAGPELSRSVPTTEPQREIWFAVQLGDDASMSYNESVTLHLTGALDIDAMRAALRELPNRHDALRATFTVDGQSMLIASQGQLAAEIVDLRGKSEDEQGRRLAALKATSAATPFDLATGPLVRAQIVMLGDASNEIILTSHHIVCDGWSFGVLCKDLMALYAALAGRGAGVLPSPAYSFADYAIDQLDDAQAAIAEADISYWVDCYRDTPPVLDLPTDRARGSERSFASRRIDHVLAPDLVDGARKLGAKQGVSLFATLFGFFAAMLDRLGGEGAVVVGVPSAGQAARGLDTLVGHCVNLLPVKVTTARQAPIGQLLQHAGGQILDAYDHQSCTFGSLLTRLDLPRVANRLPLVSVLFNIDSAIASEDLAAEGLSVSLSSNPRAFEAFELFVNATQTSNGLVLECQYQTDLFDAETIERWLQLYQCALERAIANPALPVDALFSASPDDLQKLQLFNVTAHSYPKEARIEHLFARHVAHAPEAVALVHGDETITYRELDARSNAVAHALVSHGVKAGDLVGMACGRNPHMLAAMLGILKAGAAYVPLDPSFPQARLAYMADDSGMRCMVADRSLQPFTSSEIDVILADEAAASEAPLPPLSDTDAPAYVIYTSGSTGNPKGVVVPQRAVVNFLSSMAREPGLSASDRLVAVTTTSFDIAVLELFLPLTVGARVILADRDAVMDGTQLNALIQRHDANVLQATPAGWRLLIDAGWNGGPGFKALVGGEALPDDVADALVHRSGQVWNMYGPTETTVWSTCWRIPDKRDATRIGSPIANTSIVVLDEAMKPCPIGVSGEIFIGGDGVTIGYWNRPELTADRFVSLDGQRLYRTGDRGRWRNDGTLEHLGRLDFQVKVRGYRIELGEIEASLVRHDDISRAVVVVREDIPGDVRLVAYVVPHAGKTIEPKVIRAFLRKTLPDYEIPSHVISLSAIPLLPNGKVDRRSLPPPTTDSAHRTREDTAPTTPTEDAVLRAMEEALGLRGMRTDDDFFSSGGHSLLAARLTAHLNKTFDLLLPLSTVFLHSTPKALAAFVDGSGKAERGAAQVNRQANQNAGPLTAMQSRMQFMDELHPGRVVYNTPSAHRLRGPFNRAAFAQALQNMIDRQAVLRTCIENGKDGPIQRVVDLPGFDLPFEDLSSIDAEARETALMDRMYAIIDRPIDIHAAPLFRAALYRLAEDEHVFLFMTHHIIWDGWSFDIFYEEMSAFYAAAVSGSEANLPALPASYIDYAAWQRDWLASEACADQIAHWKARYGHARAHHPLPTDKPRRSSSSGVGAVEWISLDRETTDGLRRAAAAYGATLNMVVLAAFGAILSQASASPTATIGVPVRGRPRAEFDGLMGFFTNLVPVEVPVSGTSPFMECVTSARGNLTQSLSNQDVPFILWAGETDVARAMGSTGIYHSIFSFQDARERQTHWGDLRHSSILVMQRATDDDLGLWLMESADGLTGGINFNADLFNAETARLFRDRLAGVLRRIGSDHNRTVDGLLTAEGADTSEFAAWVSARGIAPAPQPAAARQPDANAHAPAMQRLAEIWSRLLGLEVDHIDVRDNFFDLGGNSLLVMRAVTESRTALGFDIDPRRYINETLEQLSVAPADEPGSENDAAFADRIVSIWAKLLGLAEDDIHPQDNFFDLGGTSILAMQAVSAMERAIGWKIEPRRMVSETVLQLALKPSSYHTDDNVDRALAEPTPAAAASGGMLSRLFGRMGPG